MNSPENNEKASVMTQADQHKTFSKEWWQSVWEQSVWTWVPRSAKEAGESIVRNFLLHWFPAKVTRRSLSWGYSLWLGTISATLFLILAVTGIILMFYYIPSVERAYWSIKDIEFAISFGWLLRSMHRMAAHLMVAVVFFHMVRVFLTGAYRSKTVEGANRTINWLVGVVLLLFTLLLSFTGYLLPWDQLAYWAITVGTNIAKAMPLIGDTIRYLLLGGNQIEQNTLIRFYVLHVVFLPALVLALVSYHMWRIRKDGGLACVDNLALKKRRETADVPATKTYSLLGIARGQRPSVVTSVVSDQDNTVNSSPYLIRRVFLVALLTFSITLTLSLAFRAPLEEPANPAVTPDVAKAPWYFLWLQELVADTSFKIGHYTLNGAFIGGILIPGILLILLAIWPFLDKTSPETIGRWFHPERKVQNLVFLAIVVAIIILVVIGTYMRGTFYNFYWPWETWPSTPVHF